MINKIILVTCLITYLCIPAFGSSNQYLPEVSQREIYRIRIHNASRGLVQVSMNGGSVYGAVGRVAQPASVSIVGFAAAAYATTSTVAAVAVHGIRVKVGQETSLAGIDQQPLVFSIVPIEFAETPKGYGGHHPRSSGIQTDINAGHSIFRNHSPFVGSSVFIELKHTMVPIPDGYSPRAGDIFVIVVKRPICMPKDVVFENRNGGSITANFWDGSARVIAQVTEPVMGVGRFDGTTFNGIGTVNTNHPGVLTIATVPAKRPGTKEGSATETRGGFMIQPFFHAIGKTEKTQVLVAATQERSKPALEGTSPLFSGCINLAHDSERPDLSYRMEMSVDGGPWEQLPQIAGKVDNAFTAKYINTIRPNSATNVVNGVTAFRLCFPCFDGERSRVLLQADVESYAADVLRMGMKPQSGWISFCPSNESPGQIMNYYVDGRLVSSSNIAPYRFDWDSTKAANGLHSVEIESEWKSETRQILVLN